MPQQPARNRGDPVQKTASRGAPGIPLLGRDDETDVIARYLTGVRQGGRALVVRGEAGIGKSALLDEAARMAADQGMLVLKATGVQSEANLPFAGLHQLLRPILTRHDGRPAARSPVIHAAFGTTATSAPELSRSRWPPWNC
jgi:predicted ATPase